MYIEKIKLVSHVLIFGHISYSFKKKHEVELLLLKMLNAIVFKTSCSSCCVDALLRKAFSNSHSQSSSLIFSLMVKLGLLKVLRTLT